jgi:hypothetical protein
VPASGWRPSHQLGVAFAPTKAFGF